MARTKNGRASGFVLRLASPDYCFEPETLAVLSAAYDQAIAALGADELDVVREIVAKRIIEAAARGERDADRLSHAALKEALAVSFVSPSLASCSALIPKKH
jgi:hypothetical protein